MPDPPADKELADNRLTNDKLADNKLTDNELTFLESVLDLARHGRTNELLATLDAGVPVNLTSSSGDSLLILAAYHSHPDTVRALLGAGADPERINDRGQTALGAAVFQQSTDSVSALIAAGADPSAGTQSAVHIAEHFDLPQMLAQLRGAQGNQL
jgi:ankyrin repeat protein